MPTDEEAGRPDSALAGSGLPGADYGTVLWEPSGEVVQRARITQYQRWLSDRGLYPSGASGYRGLWEWSVTHTAPFWDSVWQYFDVAGERGNGPVLTGGPMPDVAWYPGATLNYAENALRTATTDPQRVAVIAVGEEGNRTTLTYGELAAEVARVRSGLRSLGVGVGDRVAAFLPNVPAALIGLLATASLGAVWSSCSPDFGPHSVIDRFAQITPKVLLAVDGYRYGGKDFDRRNAVAEIVAALPSLAAVVMVGGGGTSTPRTVPVLAFDDLEGHETLDFADVPFSHPLWVLYSSGTTGLPKAIVHSHGGIVLEHLKSVSFHQDIGPGDVFLWYTTTGWMMWNYLAGGLLAGATVVLYDGSATHPQVGALWEVAANNGVTFLGTGAPYLLACAKAGLSPGSDLGLSLLRGVGSTGSPLPPEGFRWVYEHVGRDLMLGSFSGGTDVCTGFVGACPLLPVRTGVIPGPCLGAKVEAYDTDGKPVIGEVGELVVTAPMPSMPVGFWNDPGGVRYRASYFGVYPGVWRHGDWLTNLPDGGCVIFGRSDATLNRGGVRMGTSEFYRVVERLPEVTDSLVVDTGQLGAEGRLILYVVLADGAALDDELTQRLKSTLRAELSPRHVPDEIHQVPGVPRTLSGKKLEVPVRKILLGTPVTEAADPDALANPEVMEWFAPSEPRA
ncbi:MAG TPA: acetoacetate--CoA ligase [Streptosporangiaceae bacterium]|nr:acetoacetate--CoA ligase [Streptosporangiaceae bacterium]